MSEGAHDVSVVEAAAAARAALEGGDAIAIVAIVAPPDRAGKRVLVGPGGRRRGTLGDAALDAAAERLARAALEGAPPGAQTVSLAESECVLYVEAHHAPEQLIVVGAGHIAVPVAALGVLLGFRVLVLDDREEFATADRFAAGVEVRRADFERDPFAGVRIDSRSYVALVTRGHRWDFDCLRRLLGAGVEPRYIGMIGSRRRVRAALGALLRAGYSREVLSRIVAPIGLDIGAETPEEIAVAIAAELVLVRRGGEGLPRSAQERVLERLLREEERNARS